MYFEWVFNQLKKKLCRLRRSKYINRRHGRKVLRNLHANNKVVRKTVNRVRKCENLKQMCTKDVIGRVLAGKNGLCEG